MPDLGNQHNNGPHPDQIFDNLSALALILGKQKSDLAPGGTVFLLLLFFKRIGFSSLYIFL